MNNHLKFINHVSDQQYEFAVFSGIGRRAEQQDAGLCYADDDLVYAAVCDGMGGLEGGSLASKTAVDTAEAALAEQLGQLSSDPAWLARAIESADAAVSQLNDENGTPLKCGSTFASVFIHQGNLFWASVGDSRIYLFHGQEVQQLTTDLNYAFFLNEQLQNGNISKETYKAEMADGEALVSFVGAGNLQMMDRNLSPLQLQHGDTILLCSDGLYRTIDAQWMSEILMLCTDLQESASVMQQIIEDKAIASQDNYTCILIKINQSGGK